MTDIVKLIKLNYRAAGAGAARAVVPSTGVFLLPWMHLLLLPATFSMNPFMRGGGGGGAVSPAGALTTVTLVLHDRVAVLVPHLRHLYFSLIRLSKLTTYLLPFSEAEDMGEEVGGERVVIYRGGDRWIGMAGVFPLQTRVRRVRT